MRFLVGFLLLLPAAIGQNQTLFGFLPNSGQFPPAVRFVRYSTTSSFFYLTGDSFVFFNDVRVQLVGINANSQPVGVAPTATIYNLYQGDNPSQWVTNTHAFAGVKLAAAYPGIDAEFTTSSAANGLLGESAIAFTIAPNADPSVIRLNVQAGVTPFLGPSGVWFTGGRIPGVFIVSAQASQPSGGTGAAIACNLVIDSDGTLSVQLPDRNPALETDLTVMFPDYDVFNRGAQPGVEASYLQYPVNFNEDGAIADPGCVTTCQRAVVASLDSQGNPVWVTVLGGSGMDQATFAMPDQNGIAVSGSTTSPDFPVSTTAPVVKPGSSTDVWLAYLDAASGQWLDGTYAGLPGTAHGSVQVVDPGGDVMVGGGYGADGASGAPKGFILRWQPSQNRLVYSVLTGSMPGALQLDANSNLYFAANNSSGTAGGITVEEISAAGKALGAAANIAVPSGMQAFSMLLQPATGGAVWLAYALDTPGAIAEPSAWLASIEVSTGQVLLNRLLAPVGAPQSIGLTPAGNVKALVSGGSPDDAVTPDAPLVGECQNTSYFAVWSPAGQLVYGTFVPTSGFNFAAQNEGTGPPTAAIGCLASAANHVPTSGVAPGELITIIGGGFGPVAPLPVAPQANGTYPATAGGFNVTIGGRNAPVLGVTRGEITVQAPYETPTDSGQTLTVQVFQNGQALNAISTLATSSVFGLFDTGDRNNPLNLPALAALNQDGTVNSAANPAAVGTIVSLFGTGLGVMSPPLATGALNPIPPAGPLSLTSLYNACYGCSKVLYLGSAPGLSTGMQQVNVQLPASVPGTGVQPLGIGVAVSQTIQGLFLSQASGVVFVK